MKKVIHGEDIVKSRQELDQIRKKFENAEVLIFDDKVDFNKLIQAFESPIMLSKDRLIILENFFSRKKKEEEEKFFSFLKKIPKNVNIVIWEGKELPRNILAKLGKVEISLFKLEPILFKLLDSLRPNNQTETLSLLRKTFKKEKPEVIFYMIVRQFRLLLFIKNKIAQDLEELNRLALWQKKKLVKQAEYFTLDRLIGLYNELLKIDYDQKSGNTLFSLDRALELFLINL